MLVIDHALLSVLAIFIWWLYVEHNQTTLVTINLKEGKSSLVWDPDPWSIINLAIFVLHPLCGVHRRQLSMFYYDHYLLSYLQTILLTTGIAQYCSLCKRKSVLHWYSAVWFPLAIFAYKTVKEILVFEVIHVVCMESQNLNHSEWLLSPDNWYPKEVQNDCCHWPVYFTIRMLCYHRLVPKWS